MGLRTRNERPEILQSVIASHLIILLRSEGQRWAGSITRHKREDAPLATIHLACLQHIIKTDGAKRESLWVVWRAFIGVCLII
jgi:hypothetical protein